MREPTCPRCSTALQHGAFQNVEIDKCPDCDGVFVLQRKLVPLLEAMSAELGAQIDIDAEISPFEDQEGHVACPGCGGPTDNFGYMGTKLVMVDRCKACEALWIDPGEVGAMSMLYARTNRRVQHRVAKSAERTQSTMRTLHQRQMAEAVTRMYLTGFYL